MDFLKALGFDGALAAHATASIILYVPVYRFAKSAKAIHPRLEKLLAMLIVAIVNVLVDVAREAPITIALLSSILVGAFVGLVVNDYLPKPKEPPLAPMDPK